MSDVHGRGGAKGQWGLVSTRQTASGHQRTYISQVLLSLWSPLHKWTSCVVLSFVGSRVFGGCVSLRRSDSLMAFSFLISTSCGDLHTVHMLIELARQLIESSRESVAQCLFSLRLAQEKHVFARHSLAASSVWIPSHRFLRSVLTVTMCPFTLCMCVRASGGVGQHSFESHRHRPTAHPEPVLLSDQSAGEWASSVPSTEPNVVIVVVLSRQTSGAN